MNWYVYGTCFICKYSYCRCSVILFIYLLSLVLIHFLYLHVILNSSIDSSSEYVALLTSHLIGSGLQFLEQQ